MADFRRNQLTVTLSSDPKFLPLVRAVVDEGASMAGFNDDDRHNIVLAVTEAVTNVIRHVYEGSTEKRIDLVLEAQDHRFHLDIIDYGLYVSPENIHSRPLEEVRPGGLGVHLIRSTMDEVEYNQNAHGGTTLTLVKHAGAAKDS